MRNEHLVQRLVAIATVCLFGAVGCQSTQTTSMSQTSDPKPVVQTTAKKAPAPRPAATPGLQAVYFELDGWSLKADAQRTLKANARSIKENPDWGTVTVEGHCDERGSEEYNLALGERRASAVKQYMQDLGVPSKRFRVVSFGESRPAVTGHDESAWRYNRRSELRADKQHLSSR